MIYLYLSLLILASACGYFAAFKVSGEVTGNPLIRIIFSFAVSLALMAWLWYNYLVPYLHSQFIP